MTYSRELQKSMKAGDKMYKCTDCGNIWITGQEQPCGCNHDICRAPALCRYPTTKTRTTTNTNTSRLGHVDSKIIPAFLTMYGYFCKRCKNVFTSEIPADCNAYPICEKCRTNFDVEHIQNLEVVDCAGQLIP